MAESEDVNLFIYTLDGQSFIISADLSKSVQFLKTQIQTHSGIPLHRQRLLYKSAQLKNNELLKNYSIHPGDSLYLVAKQELEADPLTHFAHALIVRNLRMYRRLRQTQSRPMTIEMLLQVLTQHTLTIDSVMNKRGVSIEVGQWVDVKDTVDQWLEAEIIGRDGEMVYVHYNGWPERWDEWIHIDSERIQPFRTKTFQTLGSTSRSPVPATRPLGAIQNLDTFELADVNRRFTRHLISMVHQWQGIHPQELEEFCENNVAVVDRVGRFMTDFAHLMAKHHDVRLMQNVNSIS